MVGTVTHSASSGDGMYNGIAINDVIANITDNDTAGVSISESVGSTDVSEEAIVDSYTVVLDTVPTGDVNVTVTPDSQTDLGSGAGTAIVLSFTPSNALVFQTLDVVAVDDMVAEGAHTSTITHSASSGDGIYNGIAINDVIANITDNDTAGVSISESGGSTDVSEEGIGDSYTVVLDTIPTANVDVTVTPDSQTDLGSGAGTAIVLSFTPGDAVIPQPVNVAAVDDAVVEGAHTSTITHSASSSDGNYNGISISDLIANITETDTAGVSINESGGSTDVSEGGLSDSYTVVLDTVPTDNVDVTITPDSQTDLGLGDGTAIVLNFTPSNALVAQTVNVTAVDDMVTEGSHTSTITHSASSSDGNYLDIPIGEVTANITDNDAPLITEVRVSSNSDDAEERASGSMRLTSSDLELVLDGGGDQTVGLRFNGVDLPQGATIVNAYLQFQADETNSVATSLTIQGEAIDNAPSFSNSGADITSRTRTTASTSWSPSAWTTVGEAGPGQRTPSIASVVEEIVDRPGWSSGNSLVVIISGSGERTAESYNGDPSGAPLLHVEYTTIPTPGVAIIQSGGSTDVSEGGSSDSYSVVLQTVPTANVDVTVTPDSETDLGSGAGTAIVLNFTPGNALTSQMVSVTAFDDAVPEGPHTGTIMHSANSSDGNCNGIQISDVLANIMDDDILITDVRVSASSDDAEERASGSMSLTSSDLELVFDSGGNQTVGMRYNSVDIPQGATIVKASVQFQADEANSAATTLTIQGEAIDNSPTFTNSSGDITSRTRTSASVAWSPAAWTSVGEAGPDQQTEDIASVIQEIVDRPGWSSGNSLVVIVTGTGERTAESYNGVPSGAPLLHVEYTTGGGSAPLAQGSARVEGGVAESFTPDEELGPPEPHQVMTAADNLFAKIGHIAPEVSKLNNANPAHRLFGPEILTPASAPKSTMHTDRGQTDRDTLGQPSRRWAHRSDEAAREESFATSQIFLPLIFLPFEIRQESFLQALKAKPGTRH